MEIDDIMKDCLIAANDNYPDLDYIDTVIKAFGDYVGLMGGPVEFDTDDEAEEYLRKCVYFLVDCVLFNMVAKGAVEIEGMEDGEFVYKISAEF